MILLVNLDLCVVCVLLVLCITWLLPLQPTKLLCKLSHKTSSTHDRKEMDYAVIKARESMNSIHSVI